MKHNIKLSAKYGRPFAGFTSQDGGGEVWICPYDVQYVEVVSHKSSPYSNVGLMGGAMISVIETPEFIFAGCEEARLQQDVINSTLVTKEI